MVVKIFALIRCAGTSPEKVEPDLLTNASLFEIGSYPHFEARQQNTQCVRIHNEIDGNACV